MKRIMNLKRHLCKTEMVSGITNGLAVNKVRGFNSDVQEKSVLVEIKNNKLALVSLNRPDKLNSLNFDMIREMTPWYKNWLNNSEIKCIVMVGSGKAFCAGGDVVLIQKELVEGNSLTEGSVCSDFFYEEYQLNHQISQLEKRNISHVSIWDGVVMGGGVGVSVHGNVRIATEKSLFAMPETGIGLFPDVGGTHVLSRLKPSYAVGMYIALTGKRLKKDDLLFTNLATHFLPSDKIQTFQLKLTELITEKPNDVVDFNVIDALVKNIEPNQQWESKLSLLETNLKNINHCFSQHSVTDIMIEVGKLAEGGDEWASKTLKELSRMSPTSLRVTYEIIKRNSIKEISLGEALKTEYRVVQRCMRLQPKSDFAEGIRALLIDKDQKPIWNPRTLSEVTDKNVEEFFYPLENSHPRGELKL